MNNKTDPWIELWAWKEEVWKRMMTIDTDQLRQAATAADSKLPVNKHMVLLGLATWKCGEIMAASGQLGTLCNLKLVLHTGSGMDLEFHMPSY